MLKDLTSVYTQYLHTYMLNVAPSPITCGKEVADEACTHNGEMEDMLRAGELSSFSHFHRNGLLANFQLHAVLLTTIDRKESSDYQYQERSFQAEQSCPLSPFVQSNLIVHMLSALAVLQFDHYTPVTLDTTSRSGLLRIQR